MSTNCLQLPIQCNPSALNITEHMEIKLELKYVTLQTPRNRLKKHLFFSLPDHNISMCNSDCANFFYDSNVFIFNAQQAENLHSYEGLKDKLENYSSKGKDGKIGLMVFGVIRVKKVEC